MNLIWRVCRLREKWRNAVLNVTDYEALANTVIQENAIESRKHIRSLGIEPSIFSEV